jgi:hypothetical protein
MILIVSCTAATGADDKLIGHWPLAGDGQDVSGNGLHATMYGVKFSADDGADHRTSAIFDGRTAWMKVPANEQLELGVSDFTVSAWVHTAADLDDVPGDILSQYDSKSRCGFHLAVKTNAGVTFSQANDRQVQFGIDQNRAQERWRDRGRPGNAVLAFALCTFRGNLYAGTCEPGVNESGHVYRYAGEDQWTDCGSPDDSNAVTSLAAFNDKLYAGTGKYRLGGSALEESQNNTLGGKIFRYDGNGHWTDCGSLTNAEAVGGLVVFRGKLYASSLYRPAGFFRYEGGQMWQDCGSPRRPDDAPGETTHMRMEALGVYNGWLYATSYDGGRVFRFDGHKWFDCGQLGDNTQTYAFAVQAGRLFVGTWRSGRVYRFEAPHSWTDVGRLGEELEVMGMLNHNGRLIAGTLPLADVYEFDGRSRWKHLTRLDHTPDVRYRRAWTMAEYGGQVFCSTLPSGRIYSWRAGRIAMADKALPSGWHHVAAVRSGGSLKIFLDGKLTGGESGFDAAHYDLSNNLPLRIGVGPNDYFTGRLSDIKLYGRALSAVDVLQQAMR